MKKILLCILAMCMALSSFSVSAKETVADTNIEYEEMLKLLNLVGIVDEEFAASESEITRGAFAALLVRSKGLDPYFNDYGSNGFSDVSDETANAAEILLAKDMGLISGYSDGSFRPEKTVSVLEAAICYTRVLGYNVKAEGMGGYPSGYYEVIRQTGLLKNISAAYTDKLTAKIAIQLIYNALHVKVLEKVSAGDDAKYESKDGNTLLYSAFSISYTDGIIEGVDISNLFGKNDLPPYYVYIGTEKFYTEYDINNLLGYHVRAYYIEDVNGYTVKLALKDSRKNKEEIIEIDTISSIADGYLKTMDEEGTEKRYSYKRTAPVIFNGTNTKAVFNKDIYKDENGYDLSGYVKLLDNNNDGKADVVFVEAYRDMLVGKINHSTYEVSDYYNAKIKYNLNTESDEPYVLIYNEDGELMETSELTEGMSLAVYSSKSDAWQTFIRVYVSTKVVTGKIEYVENEAGKVKVSLNGEEYSVSRYAIDNSLNIIVGRTVDATLNRYGEIAAIRYSVNPGDYEFAMICAAGKENSFDGKYLVKLMNNAGKISTLTVSERVKVDGKNYNTSSDIGGNSVSATLKTASEMISGQVNGNYYFQMVKYGVDSEGCINYIDTILDKDGNVMNSDEITADNEIYFMVANGKYYASNDMIAQKIIVPSECSVFMYPEVGNELDDIYYDVRDRSFFTNDTDYTGIAYFKDSNDGFEASIYMKKYSEASISGDITNFKSYIVTKVTESINEDGEKRKKWYLFNNGAESSYLVDPDLKSATTVADDIIPAKDVKPGDIIYYKVNSVTNEIEAFIIGYSVSSNKIYNISATYNGFTKAHIIKSTKSGIQYLTEDKVGYQMGATFVPTVDSEGNAKVTADTDLSSAQVFNNIKSATSVIIYDAERNTARTGSYNDIIGYMEDKDDYDRECITRWYHPTTKMTREIIIIKR